MSAYGQAQQVVSVTSTYKPYPNQALIDELDKKHRKVEKIAKNIFLRVFYNRKALDRLCRFYAFLWWKELRKNRIKEL